MISTETLAIACGIGSAAAWGAGDFSGGMASRKGNVMKVVLYSQFLGGLFLLGMAVFSGESMPPVRHLVYGAVAGVFGNIGLLALYRGLSTGRNGYCGPFVSGAHGPGSHRIYRFFYRPSLCDPVCRISLFHDCGVAVVFGRYRVPDDRPGTPAFLRCRRRVRSVFHFYRQGQ